MSSRLDEYALMIACPYCGAAPTLWCTTKSGAVATHLHDSRQEPARLAWVDGFREGQEDAVGAMGLWRPDDQLREAIEEQLGVAGREEQ